MNTMSNVDADKLLDMLKKNPRFSQEQAEALVHAMVDIAESMNKVYGEVLPRLLSEPNASADVLQDRIWDLREEFRHIDYHVHDSGVLEL
jgi:hypothetical protein